jgi:hypothetical protein
MLMDEQKAIKDETKTQPVEMKFPPRQKAPPEPTQPMPANTGVPEAYQWHDCM